MFIIILCILLSSCTMTPLPQAASTTMQIEIQGAVQQPGNYILPRDAVFSDLLYACGGYLPEADQRLYLPTQQLHPNDSLYVDEVRDMRISINTADAKALTAIPGVGEKTADTIVAYREAYGLFQTVDDLLAVKGIGPKKLERMRSYIKL